MATDTRFLKNLYIFCLAISCALGIFICINVYLFHTFPLPSFPTNFEKFINSNAIGSASYDRTVFHPFQDPKCRHFAVQVCNNVTSWNTKLLGLIKNKYATGGRDGQQSAQMVPNVLPRKWRNLGSRTDRERNRNHCYSNGWSSGLRVARYDYSRNIASINSVFHKLSNRKKLSNK